jgi:hypothetical protein
MEQSQPERELRRLTARHVREIVNARLWAYFQILRSEIPARIRNLIDSREGDARQERREVPPRL